MSEPKQEELDNLSSSSEDKNQDGPGAGDPSKKPTVEELEVLLAKEAKARGDFETAFYKEREKNRLLSERPEQPKEPTNSDPYDEDSRVKAAVQQELAERDKKQREQNILTAQNKFFEDYPQYKPQNDPNDYNYGRLREFTKDMFLGNTVEEIYKKLVVVHNGLTKPNTPKAPEKDSVEDTGIGEITPKPKSQNQQPDALTRPLTELEKQAAKLHPGGETGYRKDLARLAQGKK